MVELGLHRVPVVNKSGVLISLVSASDVVKCIHAQETKNHVADPKLEKTLEQLNCGLDKEKVYSVKGTQTVIEAFRLIKDKQISGVAVVDNEHKLIGNISASDLKVIYEDASHLIE